MSCAGRSARMANRHSARLVSSSLRSKESMNKTLAYLWENNGRDLPRDAFVGISYGIVSKFKRVVVRGGA
jgi:hypothetical protein